MLIIVAVFGLILIVVLVLGRVIDRRYGTRYPPPRINPSRVPGTRLGPGWTETCTLCGETDPYAPGKFALCPVASDNQHLIERRRA